MKKSMIFFLLVLISFFSIVFLTRKYRDLKTIKTNHAKLLEKHPINKLLQLSKKERLEKGIPPNKYFEELYLLELNPKTGRTHPENTYQVQQKLKKQKHLQQRTPGDAIDNQWIERGPNNVGGRTRMVFFDPNDNTNKRVFAGGVSGGLWVNNDITNANSSWSRVDIDENLSVTCMTVDPNNTQIMYLGTGELYVPQQALGNGIWKSTDGGTTWSNVYKVRGTTSSDNVPGTYYITDIVVRDKDGNAATTNDSEVFASIGASFYSSNPINTFLGVNEYGIFKSTDNGSNWAKLTLDVDGNSVAPNDFEIAKDNTLWLATTRNVYGKGGGRVYSSSDGTTFTLKHTISNGRRTEISVSRQNKNTLYVLGRIYTEDGSNNLIAPFVSILKTTDAFASSPSVLSLPNDADTGIPVNDFTRGQAFYDLMIEIDPNNDAIAYAGGIDLFKTTDSGSNWTQISKWSNNNNLAALDVPLVHADQHIMVFHPTEANTAIFGNDGGVYYTSNLSASISELEIDGRNKDYNTVQFYNGAISQSSSPNYFLGGSQDNGTQFFNNASSGINESVSAFGGDGTQCFIDKDGSYMIVTYLYNRILRFSLPYSANSYTTISSDASSGAFVNSMALDDNLDILYTNGTSHLARFTNIITNSPTRTNITDDLLKDITAIKVSPFTTSSSKVFVGTRTGKLVKVENANTATQTITDISGNDFLGSISSLEFGANENEIMVTFYNFGVKSIWFTADGGSTWLDKEGDFPDTNVRCILMNPLNNNEVIIGTELGVWSSKNFKDSSPNWTHSYNGMSNVVVTSLNLRTTDNTVLAATYGRGMFTGNFATNKLTSWTGNTDNDWTKVGNWSNGIPANNIDVTIPETTIKPIVSSTISVANLALEKNAVLTINNSGSLTVENNLTNNGTLTINSSALNSGSIIVKGTASGELNYNRSVTDKWHLIASPLKDEKYNNDWFTSNQISSGTQNTNQRGLGTYNNNSGAWNYVLKTDDLSFTNGKGFALLRNASGNVNFKGNVNTSNFNIDITNGTSNSFNLLGNSFASFIPINQNADVTNNFLTVNASTLAEQTIWLWNGTAYIPKNQLTTSEFLAPGQGFFVKSKSDGGIISFTTAMQNHQNGSFSKTVNNHTELKLILTSEKQEKQTSIFFLKDASDDFDNGYDSSLYTGASNNFEIYSWMVKQNSNKKLSIQALENNKDVNISLGLKATKNTKNSLEINLSNADTKFYYSLVDKLLDTKIAMQNNAILYTFYVDEDVDFKNRFVIEKTINTLHTLDENLNLLKLSILKSKIEVLNLRDHIGVFKLFNLQGKEIVNQSISTSNPIISTKNISSGIYMIEIKSDNNFLRKKIVIQN